MSASLGILFGLIAMVVWGLADPFVKIITRKIGTYHTVLYRAVVSFLFLLVIALFFAGTVAVPGTLLLFLLGMGFLGFLAFFLYVKGIEAGNVSVISPIAHASVIITVLLSLFFFRESLKLTQILAMSIIILGIILISFKYSEFKKTRNLAKGIGFALAALIGWGFLFFLWKIPLAYTSPIIVAFYVEALLFFYTLISAVPLKKKIFVPKFNKKLLGLVVIAGILPALGSLFYTIGINLEYVSLVVPIASASPFIAVIASAAFLKEKLELNQKIAVAMIVIGLIAIAL
jgi:uncharacterized membrane protein